MIDNGFARIPSDRCDYGYSHGDAPVVAVVAMVSNAGACTLERRPACRRHLLGMSYAPADSPCHFEVHYLEPERNSD